MAVPTPAARGSHALLANLCLALTLLVVTPSGPTAALSPVKGFGLIDKLLSPGDDEASHDARQKAARKLARSGDASFLAPLTDALFFTPAASRGPLLEALRALSGEDPGTGYYDWVELVGRRTDLSPPPGYRAWKAELLSRIDPRYDGIVGRGAMRIRPEEIVWGGVRLDGIPALSDPPRVAAAEAVAAETFEDDERVFGLCVDGECHAYPLRYLSWHELVNDVVGGRPIAVSFCTLCGSGVAFSAETADHRRRLFGTSGLLYRSNKLMFDSKTLTLWSNLTGEAVLGPLAGAPGEATARLTILPVAVATWGGWRRAHPQTTVTVLDDRFGARWKFRYEPGAADRARRGVSFPVWRQSDALAPDAEIYAVRLEGDEGTEAGRPAVKAYPVEQMLEQGVVNDRVGSTEVVVVGDRADGAVRAYRRDGRTFRRSEDDPPGQTLSDDRGGRWRIEEDRLVPIAEAQEGAADGARATETVAPLPRLPGHRALWFGWYGVYPDAEVFGVPSPESYRPSGARPGTSSPVARSPGAWGRAPRR